MKGRRYHPPLYTSSSPPISKARFRVEMYILVSFILVWVLFPSIVRATHETNHRFTVYGYVRDAKGSAIQDAKVMVVDNRIGEGATAFTDRSGYYEVLLHLHNQNLGDEVSITTPDETKTINASFDPADMATERKVQVDFGPMPTEKPSSPITLWMYGAGGALIIAAFLYWGVYSRKKLKPQSHSLKKGKKK